MGANGRRPCLSWRKVLFLHTRLDNAAELIAGRSPERILRLGFAVVRTGGKAVVSARGIRKGDALEIEVADGTIHGTAQSTEPK